MRSLKIIIEIVQHNAQTQQHYGATHSTTQQPDDDGRVEQTRVSSAMMGGNNTAAEERTDRSYHLDKVS